MALESTDAAAGNVNSANLSVKLISPSTIAE